MVRRQLVLVDIGGNSEMNRVQCRGGDTYRHVGLSDPIKIGENIFSVFYSKIIIIFCQSFVFDPTNLCRKIYMSPLICKKRIIFVIIIYIFLN